MNYEEANAVPAPVGAEDEVNLIDIALVLAKRKKTIMIWTLVGVVLGALAAFLIRPSYRATTVLLPPQQAQSGAAALLSQLGGAAGALASAGGLKSQSDVYVGILKSRTLGDKIVTRFDLKAKYDEETVEDTRRQLAAYTSVSAAKDGLITISVEDHDPQQAPLLANAYVQELELLTQSMALTEASQRRLFFERQLAQAKDKLSATEVAMKRSMDANGMVSVDGESRAMIETVGRLRGMLSAKEIQLDSMKSVVTAENPEYKKVQSELNSLRLELQKLSGGRPGAATAPATTAGLANIQLLRDLKYFQMLYELLGKQYEAARLDEARDAALIQVLDIAIVPERKFKPRRALLILLGALFGFGGALLYVFATERMRSVAKSESGKWQQLRTYLRGRPVSDKPLL